MLGFGLLTGLIFPPYAALFVQVRPGMLPLFAASCVLAGLAVGGINYWLMRTVLVAPLRKLAAAARAMAGGDLSAPVALGGTDDLSQLASSVDDLRLRQARFVREIAAVSAQLKHAHATFAAVTGETRRAYGAVRSLSGAAAEMFAGHERSTRDALAAMAALVDGVRQLSAGARQGAAHTAVAAGQMAAAVEDSGARVTATAETATRTADMAKRGEEAVESNLALIGRVHATVAATAGQMTGLHDLVGEISAVAATIRGLADGTNMLSLNASIEAARAGEHGRGFAVVAEEVRRLAQLAAHSALQIMQLVGRIGEAVTGAGAAMNGCVAASRTAQDQSEEALTILQLIHGLARETERWVADMQAAGGELDARSREAREAMTGVLSVAEGFAEATEPLVERCRELEQGVVRLGEAGSQTGQELAELNALVLRLAPSLEQARDLAEALGRLSGEFAAEAGQYRLT
ncbi:MAG TPA: methyl-accepting chemotaxis protein [Symbiobacteriaceae bacterium]|nr:methyl-accepting chemotaxis protein [Symbiobacteriaceae bacterium]